MARPMASVARPAMAVPPTIFVRCRSLTSSPMISSFSPPRRSAEMVGPLPIGDRRRTFLVEMLFEHCGRKRRRLVRIETADHIPVQLALGQHHDQILGSPILEPVLELLRCPP